MMSIPVSSPARLPTIPAISIPSRAEQAARGQPGMVLTTTRFWAASTETTPSLKMFRSRPAELFPSCRSAAT